MAVHKGLLEMLREHLGCPYVSALRQAEHCQQAARLAGALETDDFSLEEWCDATGYITGERPDLDSVEAAKEFLARWCAPVK